MVDSPDNAPLIQSQIAQMNPSFRTARRTAASDNLANFQDKFAGMVWLAQIIFRSHFQTEYAVNIIGLLGQHDDGYMRCGIIRLKPLADFKASRFVEDGFQDDQGRQLLPRDIENAVTNINDDGCESRSLQMLPQ